MKKEDIIPGKEKIRDVVDKVPGFEAAKKNVDEKVTDIKQKVTEKVDTTTQKVETKVDELIKH
jgi:hypothetical protein